MYLSHSELSELCSCWAICKVACCMFVYKVRSDSHFTGRCWCMPISFSLWACSYGNCDKYAVRPSRTDPQGTKFILMKLAWPQRNLGDFLGFSALCCLLTLSWLWRSKCSCLRYGFLTGSWDLGQSERGMGKILQACSSGGENIRTLYTRFHGLWELQIQKVCGLSLEYRRILALPRILARISFRTL